jgi:hypothetical protein
MGGSHNGGGPAKPSPDFRRDRPEAVDGILLSPHSAWFDLGEMRGAVLRAGMGVAARSAAVLMVTGDRRAPVAGRYAASMKQNQLDRLTINPART